ncbi:Retrovirus-related Pol polyprotein from transposon TNT 1-94 [Senna tora]|uniref:Retrovirus-related Pol polyprotein from transposon TNT 1-94 n=1 Tax=Senna tora TaxID=362788 RepID=A0A834T0D1_9FABA|nr:Retrovirus-related Pol polyprotein from transposon TNT 1-94 [Senna tora]
MAEKADIVDPQTPQSSCTSSIPLIEKEKNVIAFNHNLSVKLDDKNYLLWRQQILAALEGHDLEKYIAGSRFFPPKFDTEGYRDAGKLSLNYLKWKTQDKLILSWLLGSMTESMLTHVNECEHSYEAWNIMIEQFGINTKARVHLYKTELRGIKKGTETMSEFLLKIKAIAGALRAIGSPISEHEHMQYILEVLPQEYESFVTSTNMKTDLTSIGKLEALLIAQEVHVDQSLKAVKSTKTPSANVALVDQKDKNNQSKSNQPGPFRAFNNFRGGGRNGGGRFNNYRGGSSRGRGGSNFNQGFNRPFVVCQVCSKTGHIASACYNRYDSNYQLSQQQYSQNFAQARQRSSGNMSALVATLDAVNDAAWFPDSGATNHVTSDASNLMNGVEYIGAEQLHMGNGKGLLISNVGQSLVKLQRQLFSRVLLDLMAFITPDGLYYFTDFKLFHQSSQPDCSIQSSSSASPIVLASTVGSSLSNSVTSNCTAVTPYTLWHCRLGHCNSATVMAVLKQCNFDVSNKDLWGPSPIKSRNGASYYISFIDACSKFTWIYPLKNKSNALQAFTEFKKMVELQTGFSIKALQSDGGAPYNKHKLQFRSLRCTFIGYSTLHKGYKCLAPNGRIYISRDVKFDEISFPYKDVSFKPLVSVPSNVISLSSASPPLAVQYETSVKPVTVTNTNNCVVSTNEMVCDNSVSTGVGGSTKSTTNVDSSAFSDLKDLSTLKDQATNVHPMVTRAKAGVFKPKILLAHVVPIGSSSQFISQLKCRLNAEFSLKDIGKLHYFLGIEVNHMSDGSLHLS